MLREIDFLLEIYLLITILHLWSD